MTDKRFWLGILVIALVFGMMFIGCKDGSGDVENTIIVQDIPADIYGYGSLGGSIGLFPIGTTPDLADGYNLTSKPGCVAGAHLFDGEILSSGSNYTLKFPLKKPDGYNPWTGSGLYVIYVQLGAEHYYKSSSPVIISATTTIHHGV